MKLEKPKPNLPAAVAVEHAEVLVLYHHATVGGLLVLVLGDAARLRLVVVHGDIEERCPGDHRVVL